jgi:hypothetical protein
MTPAGVRGFCRFATRAWPHSFNHFLQHDCIIVFDIFGCKHQGHAPAGAEKFMKPD